MSAYLIDLTKAPFWLALVIAALLVAPLARGQSRSPLFALVNLGFIAVLMGWRAALLVLAGTAVVWLLAMASRRTRQPAVWALLGGGLAMGLFLLHKLPAWSAWLHLQAVNHDTALVVLLDGVDTRPQLGDLAHRLGDLVISLLVGSGGDGQVEEGEGDSTQNQPLALHGFFLLSGGNISP